MAEASLDRALCPPIYSLFIGPNRPHGSLGLSPMKALDIQGVQMLFCHRHTSHHENLLGFFFFAYLLYIFVRVLLCVCKLVCVNFDGDDEFS